MKKFITLLFIALAFAGFNTNAQTTVPTCNASFTYVVYGNYVHVIPAVNTDSQLVSHEWTFGDTAAANHTYSPYHYYAIAGTYVITHTITRVTPNNVVSCTASFKDTITISAPCNIQAYFTQKIDSLQYNKVYFGNTTVNLATTDSVYWTFGDSSKISFDTNPTHIYAQGGTYNVCLHVKRATIAGATPCVSEYCRTITITPPCNFTPTYTYKADSINTKTIAFTNTTTALYNSSSSIRWYFGDGTYDSTWNTKHTYAQAGKYYVCLRIQASSTCVKYQCDSITVTVPPPPPCDFVPTYTWKADSINTKKINFTNTTLPVNTAASVKWIFGDGSPADSGYVVSHTYSQAGKYYVCMRVQFNSSCVKYKCDSIIVTVPPTPCDFTPTYTWKADSSNTKQIDFTNTTTLPSPIVSVRWYFGDNTFDSTWNTKHTYAQAGKYYVCLRIQTSSNCVKYKCDSVTVTLPPCDFTPNYTWEVDSANTEKVYFSNTSILTSPTAGINWYFGDGSSGTGSNVMHQYAKAGKYYVCMRVANGTNCVKYKCDSIVITAPVDCGQLSAFSIVSTSDTHLFYFSPIVQSKDVQYTWTFGDNAGTHDMVTSHRYATAGQFTTCLTSFKNATCASTTCKPISIKPIVNCDTVNVSYKSYQDQSIPNRFYFYATSNVSMQQQTWTIYKRGSTASPIVITQNNPDYTFTDTGYYYVCLSVVTTTGCTKTYCGSIYVQTLAQPCQLLVSPNPANTSTVNVYVQLIQPAVIHVSLYSLQNVLLLTKEVQGFAGNNSVELNVANLAAGAYVINLVYADNNCVAKFQKN